MMMSGYHHLSREFERNSVDLVLKGDLDFLDYLTPDTINTYPLADDTLRSMKNNVICTITVICRAVADVGVEPGKCFALSDYYINLLERQTTPNAVCSLTVSLIRHFSQLVKEERLKSYSLPIVRTIQYIHGHLFEVCRVKDIAMSLNIHPNYLSSLFREEVGIALTDYVKSVKLEEAKNLLLNSEYSITEISEMLGYNSVSYFSKDFSKNYNCSPKKYIASNIWNLKEPEANNFIARRYGQLSAEKIREILKEESLKGT
jgi:AraC-like DNA-binding protein